MPRSTPTLQALAEQHAHEQHTRRLAEIQDMAPLLAHLDKLVPALAERGLQVPLPQLHLVRMSLGDGHSSPRHKVLRIPTMGLCSHSQARRWYFALVELGARLVHVDDSKVYPQATLRLKHLLLRVDIDPADAPALREALSAATQPAVVPA